MSKKFDKTSTILSNHFKTLKCKEYTNKGGYRFIYFLFEKSELSWKDTFSDVIPKLMYLIDVIVTFADPHDIRSLFNDYKASERAFIIKFVFAHRKELPKCRYNNEIDTYLYDIAKRTIKTPLSNWSRDLQIMHNAQLIVIRTNSKPIDTTIDVSNNPELPHKLVLRSHFVTFAQTQLEEITKDAKGFIRDVILKLDVINQIDICVGGDPPQKPLPKRITAPGGGALPKSLVL